MYEYIKLFDLNCKFVAQFGFICSIISVIAERWTWRMRLDLYHVKAIEDARRGVGVFVG